MTENYILYNPYAGNGSAKIKADALCDKLEKNAKVIDITTINNYKEFFENALHANITICGGDGTLNRFINDTSDIKYNNKIMFLPQGTGNDFLRDLDYFDENSPLDITDKIKSLPICTVNGKDYRFINGIGYGIDGYCCEEGDNQKAQGKTDISYTAIAIKGLLFHYKTTNAKVTVDGNKHRFKKVWLAPTMFGRYYGGGMMPTPQQDRNSIDKTVSFFVFFNTSALKTLMIFPSLFKGEHLRHKECTKVLVGKKITVEFDSPRALQIDGETIPNVTSYTVTAPQ